MDLNPLIVCNKTLTAIATSLQGRHCIRSMLTAEEEHVEGLMRLQNDEVRSKHDPSCLLLVVVHLHSRVTGTTIGDNTRPVPILLSGCKEEDREGRERR